MLPNRNRPVANTMTHFRPLRRGLAGITQRDSEDLQDV
jgi:hypothetical protein